MAGEEPEEVAVLCSVAVDNAEVWASGEEPVAVEDSSVLEQVGHKEAERETGTTMVVEEVVAATVGDDSDGGTMTSLSARASRRLTCGRSGRCWKRWTLTVCRS